MFRVRVYNGANSSQRTGSGLFAEALINQFPDLPMEEEGRLQDWKLRENFIERVFSYYRWIDFVNSQPRPKDLVNFHTRQKLAILAHSRTHYQQLGQLVAQAGKKPIQKILPEYRHEGRLRGSPNAQHCCSCSGNAPQNRPDHVRNLPRRPT